MKLFQVDKDMPKLVSDHFIESINSDTSGLESLNLSHFETYSELVQNETMFLYNLFIGNYSEAVHYRDTIMSIARSLELTNSPWFFWANLYVQMKLKASGQSEEVIWQPRYVIEVIPRTRTEQAEYLSSSEQPFLTANIERAKTFPTLSAALKEADKKLAKELYFTIKQVWQNSEV